MHTPALGEFLGTAVLVFLGDGVNAGVLLRGSKAENSGWIVITAGWAFAVFCGVVTAIAFGSTAAHLNPAITVAAAIQSGDYTSVAPFIGAQMAGAFLGATLVWLFYFPHWRVTPDPVAKLAVFCTIPAIRSPFWNLLAETLATSILLLTTHALSAHALVSAASAPALSPYLVGIIVWSIGLSLGGVTGYAINPARDLSPRLAHALLPISGKGRSDWPYAPVPVLGPLLGALATGLFLRIAG
jgi:glycerol uptake facilitator protein